MTLDSWETVLEEIEDKNANLLLGNGFSIGYSQSVGDEPGFGYESIFHECRESLSLDAAELESFALLKTANFEDVLRAHEDSSRLMEAYGIQGSPVFHGAPERMKKAFLGGLKAVHPDSAEVLTAAHREAAREFLGHFEKGAVFTLNYDLLLYWVRQARDGRSTLGADGFSREDGVLIFDAAPTRTPHFWNLHGGLHLFRHEGCARKCESSPGSSLMSQLTESMAHGRYPMIVLEGKVEQKVEAIRDNRYLSAAFAAFQKIEGPLVTFGVRLGDEDQHVADAIGDNKRASPLFVGVHSHLDELRCKTVFGKPSERVRYFDTSKMDVWGRRVTDRPPSPERPRAVSRSTNPPLF